ncbi:MAG: phosphate uptake regulator, PhoU [Bacteroidetes bacterium]|nr:phosphate uptake regulator, PhoU [Bacteroidota bacterium]
MERRFEKELDELKANLTKMGRLVDEQIDLACHALFQADADLARQVLHKDESVDELDTLIDKQCQEIFALSQPVAVDLRLLMSALKINNELERIGDIAVNIAERVEPLAIHNGFLRGTRLAEMTQIARIMVSDGIESFISNNPRLAKLVLESDDVVDSLDASNFKQMVREMQRDHTLIEPASHILILSRHIERLADHATNIAEDVIFLVDAKIVKHNALEELEP